jgi:hypothetical protein
MCSSLGYHDEGTGTYFGVPRSTARGRRNMGVNGLDGTLPAELGKLTDLESLCAALRRRRAAIGGPVGAALTRFAVVCRYCSDNKLSGTIGSWIGSMAKLTLL